MQIDRCVAEHCDMIEARVRRPAVHPLDHPQDVVLLATQLRFDRSVGTIADPAADSELARFALCPCAIEDALHAAGHADMAADERHQTVEMSGASSAFIPTTL